MRNRFKILLMTTLAAVSFSSLAIQKDITVNASVDAQLEMTQADKTALPSSITMTYLAGSGLNTYSLNTKIWSNSASDVQVRLLSAAAIAQADGSNSVPLTVRLGDTTLTTTNQPYTAATLFPTGDVKAGSVTLPLSFAQTTPDVIATGQYTGIVSLLLTQGTATN